MGRHSSVGHVPQWFKLANYAYLKDLGAAGWAPVVSEIKYLRELTADVVAKFELEPEESTESVINEIFSESLATRVTDYEHYYARFKADPDMFRFPGVAALDIDVVAYMAATLATIEGGNEAIKLREARAKAQRKGGRIPKAHREFVETHSDFLRKPFFLAVSELQDGQLTENRAISVNMELPDDLLIAGFKDWLAATRKLDLHRAAPRTYDRNDFMRWAEFQYVPLIILKKWAEVSGTPLAFQELANALFPDSPEVTGEHIRKTHWPNAQSWATSETFTALAAQSAKEAGKNLPAKQ